jgi:hypothetical protein
VCSVQPAGCPVQSLHGHTTDQLASAISKANRTSQQRRRSSQKPPAELYETFKSKFPGIAHNANVNTTTSADVVSGATALDVAPSVLPMYVRTAHAYAPWCALDCILTRVDTDNITDPLLQTLNR